MNLKLKRKKEYNYFSELEKMADFSYEAAVFLRKALGDFKMAEMEKKVIKMHEIEHNADLRKQDMMNRMAKEFMTPIDREDIIDLAQSLDNVTDEVEEVLMKIHVFQVRELKTDALDFAELVVRCCAALKESMKEFSRFHKSKSLAAKLLEIHKLEEEADALYAKSVKMLFLNSQDPIELFVWTQIYDCLEECSDACDEVAEVIESVVMKNT